MAICQYEDDCEVYMHTARDVYKDLVNVRRAAEGSSVDVETATEVFMVTELVGLERFGRKDDNKNHMFLLRMHLAGEA